MNNRPGTNDRIIIVHSLKWDFYNYNSLYSGCNAFELYWLIEELEKAGK